MNYQKINLNYCLLLIICFLPCRASQLTGDELVDAFLKLVNRVSDSGASQAFKEEIQYELLKENYGSKIYFLNERKELSKKVPVVTSLRFDDINWETASKTLVFNSI